MSKEIKTHKLTDLNVLLLIANSFFTCENYGKYIVCSEKEKNIYLNSFFNCENYEGCIYCLVKAKNIHSNSVFNRKDYEECINCSE